MKRKSIMLATFLVASLALGSTAQAHDDYGYPIGLLSGVILGLSLDHDDHYYYYRDRPNRHYRHREYRRSYSHGHRIKRHRGHHRHHGHDRHGGHSHRNWR